MIDTNLKQPYQLIFILLLVEANFYVKCKNSFKLFYKVRDLCSSLKLVVLLVLP